MKDIDFDELDRAVNSIMATVPSTGQNDQASERVATPVDRSATSSPQPTARQESAPVTVAPASPVRSLQRPAMPAARRGGKFMDMVHAPTSQKPSSQPSAPASREGLSITPRPRVELAPQQPLSQPTSSTSPSPSQEFSPEPVSDTTPSTPEPVIEAPAAESSQTPSMPYGPAESPFISNAVVEKRPLNSSIAAGSVEEEPATNADLALPDESPASEEPVQAPADNDQDEPPENPQMPELQSELVAIESNDVTETPAQSTGASAESLTPAPKAAPLGAASIAQQYTTTPSTGDQSHAAIYDASDYPQPIAHPTKQRSSWWWVLWVVILLAVGAGGAVLLYNVGIIP